jgi:hypothetical protein
MNQQAADPSSAVHVQSKWVNQLKEAEEQVCRVLQLTAETCGELEQLPFSDPAKLSAMSEEVMDILQSVRATMMENIEAMQPVELHSDTSGSSTDIANVATALKRLDDALK